MSPSKKKPEVPVEDGVHFVTIRGTTYRIDELGAGEYEDEQRTAEIPDKDGDGTVTDMLLLLKLVTLKSVSIVADPGDPVGQKLDPGVWAKEKYPVVSRVQSEVRRLHFMALTDDEQARAAEADKRKDPNG